MHLPKLNLKMPKQLLDKLVDLFNERSAHEKKMILIFGVLILVAIDWWVLIQPAVDMLTKNTPVIQTVKKEIRQLKQDKRNRRLIDKDWQDVRAKLDVMETSFTSGDETNVLLEYLSKEAQSSGVRIVSIKPRESEEKTKNSPYHKVPIQITATSSTHELGQFLSALESGPRFFRVTDLKVTANASGGKNHSMEMEIEGYRRTGAL